MGVETILGIILGIIAAIGLASYIVSVWAKKSNDAGDSTGTFQDFSKYDLFVMAKNDNGTRSKYEQMIEANRRINGNTRWVPAPKDQMKPDPSNSFIG